MRLFVALPIPENVRAEVAGWVSRAAATAPSGLRWATPGQWHLTLVFLGETPDDQLPDVVAAGSQALREAKAPMLALRGGGQFTDRVLWIGLAEAEGVQGLARLLRLGVAAAGIAFDDKPFRPHLTVARAGAGRSVDLVPAAEALAEVAGSPWRADGVDLVRSRLGAGPGGSAAHETIATWALA